jgi:hypothetical protein
MSVYCAQRANAVCISHMHRLRVTCTNAVYYTRNVRTLYAWAMFHMLRVTSTNGVYASCMWEEDALARFFSPRFATLPRPRLGRVVCACVSSVCVCVCLCACRICISELCLSLVVPFSSLQDTVFDCVCGFGWSLLRHVVCYLVSGRRLSSFW